VLLDTHALLWLVRGEFRTAAAIAAVRTAQEEGCLYVSAISAWELGVAELKRRDRPDLGMPAAAWFRQAVAATGARLAAISISVAAEASTVPTVYGSGDPGDCFIIATARVRRMSVVTRDGRMLALAMSAPDYLEAVEC
jgi:PIN domain nuclease of toxin-antitoxin system